MWSMRTYAIGCMLHLLLLFFVQPSSHMWKTARHSGLQSLFLVAESHIPILIVETEQGVAQAIIRSVIDFKRDPWPKVSESAKDLVKKMLDPDPSRRLTAQQVLGNAYLPKTKLYCTLTDLKW